MPKPCGLIEPIVRWAQESGSHPAIIEEGRTLSYAELLKEMRILAGCLMEIGIPYQSPVAIYLEPGARSYSAVAGTLAAGCPYVPIGTDTPLARIRYMLEHSGAQAVFCGPEGSKTVLEILSQGGAPGLKAVIVFDEDEAPIAAAGLGCRVIRRSAISKEVPIPLRNVRTQDRAYIIYTSGTTGAPKGVVISIGNALAFVDWALGEFKFRPSDRIVGMTELSFDISVLELFCALFSGATIVPFRTKRERAFPGDLLRRHRITAMCTVPSITSSLAATGDLEAESFPDLRLLILGGEALSVAHAKLWRNSHPRLELHNAYGPTEATVACVSYRIGDRVPESTSLVPVGKARGHTKAELSQDGRILLRGPQVSLEGYLDAPELNRERFSGNDSLARTLNTGDLGVLDADGNLCWAGRADDQVKLRGFRIEPAEIDSVLQKVEGVRAAACACDPEAGELRAVVCLLPGVEGSDRIREQLLRSCQERLPTYMIPRVIEFHAELPVTLSGKLDRRAVQAILFSKTRG